MHLKQLEHPLDNLNYGIIGNCKSSALINEDSSIDWCCLPQFDSASVFAKILDEKKGGFFKIACDDSYKITQSYIDKTAILTTRFDNGIAAFEIIDFMPRYQKDNGVYYAPPEISRIIKKISGQPEIKILYDPRLEYAQGTTKNYIKDDFIISIVDDKRYDTLLLYTDMNKSVVLDAQPFILDRDYFFKISYNEKIQLPSMKEMLFEFERTKVYWLNWCHKTPTYNVKYNDQILRSAMTLKLLTFEKTGAVLAAATTSLPETIGEVRNWDYRFCWIRDASMVIKVIAKLGHLKIVKEFIEFIIDLIPDKDEKLQIMYGIRGEKMLTEKTLDHLSGYCGQNPLELGMPPSFKNKTISTVF
jgi:GH15 family glucan-1,4-alpha-glucosidase